MILEKRQQQHSHQQGMPQLGQDNHSATARGDDLEDAVCALAGKYLLPPAVQSTAGGGYSSHSDAKEALPCSFVTALPD
jgi:hypothetical protein